MKTAKKYFGLGVSAVVTLMTILSSGCIQQENSQQEETTNSGETKTANKETWERKTIFTIEDVSQHNSPGDCWLVIHDRVYNVTDWISSHPGGKAMLEGCGNDATELFETRPMGSGTPHSQNARNRLDDYYIGDFRS